MGLMENVIQERNTEQDKQNSDNKSTLERSYYGADKNYEPFFMLQN